MNPLTLRALIDNGVLTKDADLVIWRAILIAVLALIDEALVLTERRISAHIGESLIYDGRSKVFRNIQLMSLAFFTRSQSGALVSRLNNDVAVAQHATIDLLPNLVGNLQAVVSIGVSGLRREESRRVRQRRRCDLGVPPMTGQSTFSSSMAGRFFTALRSWATLPCVAVAVCGGRGIAFLVVLGLALVRGLLFVPIAVVRRRISF